MEKRHVELIYIYLMPLVWEKGYQEVTKESAAFKAAYEADYDLKNIDEKICNLISDEITSNAKAKEDDRKIQNTNGIGGKQLLNYFIWTIKGEPFKNNPNDSTTEYLCAYALGSTPDMKRFNRTSIFMNFIKNISNSKLLLSESIQVEAQENINVSQETYLDSFKSEEMGVEENGYFSEEKYPSEPFSVFRDFSKPTLIYFIGYLLLNALFIFILIVILNPPKIYTSQTPIPIPIQIQISVANIILIIFVFLIISSNESIEKINNERNRKLKNNINRFMFGIKSILSTWVLLYGWIAWGAIFTIDTHLSQIIADFLNILSSISFMYVFFIMDIDVNKDCKKFNKCIIIVLISSLTVFIISSLDIYFNLDLGIKIILPIFLSVSMMYFFGRLNSKYFNINRLALFFFYLYAAIQNYWNSDYTEVILWFALFLKLVLFVFMFNWLTDGKVRDYFSSEIFKNS